MVSGGGEFCLSFVARGYGVVLRAWVGSLEGVVCADGVLGCVALWG